jgi:hypothetical protein
MMCIWTILFSIPCVAAQDTLYDWGVVPVLCVACVALACLLGPLLSEPLTVPMGGVTYMGHVTLDDG